MSKRPTTSSTPKKAWTNARHMLLISSTKFWCSAKGAAVVMDAVDAVVGGLAGPLPCEHVYLMPAPFEGGGQLRHMNGHAAHGDRVQGFPRKQCDPHVLWSFLFDRRCLLPWWLNSEPGSSNPPLCNRSMIVSLGPPPDQTGAAATSRCAETRNPGRRPANIRLHRYSRTRVGSAR